MNVTKEFKGGGFFWLADSTACSFNEIPDEADKYSSGELSFVQGDHALLSLMTHPLEQFEGGTANQLIDHF